MDQKKQAGPIGTGRVTSPGAPGVPGTAEKAASPGDYTRLDLLLMPEAIRKKSPTLQAYSKGEIRVLVDRNEKMKAYPGQETETSSHLSISCADRYPTWDEINEARYRFLPRDREAYMVLPAEHQDLNRMPFCFHVFMSNLIDQPERK